MKRISTLAIAAIGLMAISIHSFGQTSCAMSTTPPSPTINLNQTVSSTNGFSASGQAPIGTFPNGSTSTLISPVFSSGTGGGGSSISFALHLASATNAGSQITGYTIKIVYQGGSSTCGNTAPVSLTSTGADYYFTINSVPPVPANKPFQIYLSLDVAGGPSNKDVIASTFGINYALAAPGVVLPVKFASFNAFGSGKTNNLSWTVGTEQNLNGYYIERSSDGGNYSQIGFVAASGKTSYYFVDVNPFATSYYRLKSVDIDGKYGYSSVAVVKADGSSVMMKAFPSPVVSKVIIQHTTTVAGSNLTISAADGRLFKSLAPTVGTQQTEIDLSSAKAGLYLVRYSTPTGEVGTIKVIKQ